MNISWNTIELVLFVLCFAWALDEQAQFGSSAYLPDRDQGMGEVPLYGDCQFWA